MIGKTRGSFDERIGLLAAASLIATFLPFVVNVPAAAAADVVLPPILLVGNDAEDDGNGNGNPASRVDTWSYQIQNPNPFDLTATIETNTTSFDEGAVGPPTGNWVSTQVVSVLVPANSQTPIVTRLAKPAALGTTIDRDTYGFRAIWDDYPSAESNYVGLRWPTLLTIQQSLGAPFTDPGLPFVGTGGVIHGLIDNRGPDFAASFVCDFDAAGNPTGDYSYHWWIQNSAFTGNPELINVELAQPGGALYGGLGIPRQSIAWADVRTGADPVSGAGVTVEGWQEARGWFRPQISSASPGGTAGDNTWPWDGSTPPGSVWALNSSPYSKHTRMLLHADDCATKYANLPVYNGTGPVVAITSPSAGSSVSGSVMVQVDATDDDPAGSLNVEVSIAGGGWAAATWNPASLRYEYAWDTTATAEGSATLAARATDSDTNTTKAAPIAVTVDNVAGSLVVAAADIGRCDLSSDNDTGLLLDSIFAAETGTIAIPGDIAYPNGSTADFLCFNDAWGQHKPLMRPAPGNHEYLTAGAAGYYTYFGAQAGDPDEGFYTWDIDANWMGIALNSNCAQIAGGCAAGGAQEQWLRGVLAANSGKNVLAIWHHPRWSNNTYNDNPIVQPLWQALYEYGADLVLVGHEHHYERYQPLDAAGNPDPQFGIREFIVGTGGTDLRAQQRPPSPLSEEQQYEHHGVLKLSLEAASYSWEFVSVGGGYTDTGSQPVHGAPNISPIVSIAAPSQGSIVSATTVVQVDATDDDPAGTLDVAVSIAGGGWAAATWNAAASRYEYQWDTTATADGPTTIDARATDSDGNVTNAPTRSVTVGNSPATDYRTAVIAAGADVYWRLADAAGTAAVDEFGGNNATYVGAPGLGSPGLIIETNAAVGFDGVDDAIHLTNSAEINQGGPYLTKSIEMWFEVSSTAGRQTLYEQGSVSRGMSLYVDNGLLYAGVYNTSDNGGDTPWGPVFLSTPVTAGTPHHAVMVFDQPSDTFSLYIDGTLAQSAGGIGTLHNHGLSAIGAQRDWARYHTGAQSGERNFVAGTIDEVALYPSALSGTTIADHYSIGSTGGNIAPTVAITAPAAGATVSGTTLVQVDASDDDPAGTLSVEVAINSGAFIPAVWNPATSRYEYSWDTTALSDGPATIDARATDSDTNTTNATPTNVTVTNVVAALYSDAVLGDGAWVYWRLGETSGSTMVDELGGNDQTYSGSPILGAPGLITDPNPAVRFDGVDDIVNLANSLEINRENPALTKTIELWFNADEVNRRQVLLEQGSVSRGLNIYLDAGQLWAGTYNTTTNGPDSPWGPVFISAPVAAATTYHMVLVFDQPSDSFTMYLNGSAVASSGGIGGLYRHGRAAIGGQAQWAHFHTGAQNNVANYFAGTLDEIAIYPTALGSAAIAAHYAAGTT